MNIIPKIQTYTCPCCNGYIGEAAPIADVMERAPSGQQRLILEMLSRKIGRKVAKDAILERLYDGRPDGGPGSADGVIGTQLTRLRKFIAQFGWTILTTGGGRGSPAFYSLVPMEAGA